MKKIISIVSLLVLVFGNLAQCFANTSFTIEELGNTMLNFLNAEAENNETTKGNQTIQDNQVIQDIKQQSNIKTTENNEEGVDEIEYIGGNEHIVWNKTKGTITAYPNDYSYGITMEDKNLGADIAGTGEQSYGYIYQRGNNHPQLPGGETTQTPYYLEYKDLYDGVGYNGEITKFIYTEGYSDIRAPGESYPNIRGGGNDGEENNYGYNDELHLVTNVNQRKGPCIEGSHIPSRGEWSKLHYMYNDIKGDSIFFNDFKLAIRGVYITTNETYSSYTPGGDDGTLWSSTPQKYNWYGDPNIKYSTAMFYYGSKSEYLNSPTYVYQRNYGTAIRCFKNNWMETVTIKIGKDKYLTQFEHGETFNANKINNIIEIPEGYHLNLYKTGENNYLEKFNIEENNIKTTITLFGEIVKNENGIFTEEDGLKRITRDDINIIYNPKTITGVQRGSNNPGEEASTDHNARGGANDNYLNNYGKDNDGLGRKGPCDTGYHVSSVGDLLNLFNAYCNINKNCELRNINGLMVPFGKNDYELLYDFTNDLGLTPGINIDRRRTPFWTSSHGSSGPRFAGPDLHGLGIYSQSDIPRTNTFRVLCIQNKKYSISYLDKYKNSIVSTGNIIAGTKITDKELPKQRTGYTNHYYLTGYKREEIENILEYEITNNTNIYIDSIPNNSTPYKVEHYKESLNGDFKLIESKNYIGTTDSLVTGEYNIYEGFTGLKIEPQILSGSGTTIVKIKYERNTHKLSINGNTTWKKFGTEIVLEEGKKDGYKFMGREGLPEISGDNKYYMPDKDVTITSVWEKNGEGTSSAGGGSTITPRKQETKTTEKEHSTANTTEENEITSKNATQNETINQSVEERIQTISPKSLTRGELAVFSNILIDIFPKLTEGKKNVNEYCTEYTDYNEFSRKEQKAVSKLCRLAIMGIHEDDQTPLETFGVHNLSTNEEFIKVINRMTNKFSDDELKDLKSALSSLEENKEDNLVFGTVVDVFKKVKELFN